MEELFEDSVLQELYEKRNEEVSHFIIKHNKEYKEKTQAMENKLKQILNYVPGEHYRDLEMEIENFLYEHVLELSEFWCSKYYKVGFADGLNVKKEIQSELEGVANG